MRDTRSFNDLPKDEQDRLIWEYINCKKHNYSLPPWDGRDTGIYATKRKPAGRPSHELEKKRGYVT